jgi:hypothetical protein
LLPNVPTLAELGLNDFDSQGWFAVFAPPNLADSMLVTPDQLRAIVKSENESIARLVKAQGIKAD